MTPYQAAMAEDPDRSQARVRYLTSTRRAPPNTPQHRNLASLARTYKLVFHLTLADRGCSDARKSFIPASDAASLGSRCRGFEWIRAKSWKKGHCQTCHVNVHLCMRKMPRLPWAPGAVNPGVVVPPSAARCSNLAPLVGQLL